MNAHSTLDWTARDERKAAIATLVSRRCHERKEQELPAMSILDCWDMTPTGCFERAQPSLFIAKRSQAIKTRIQRLTEKAAIKVEAMERYLTTRKQPSNSKDPESASKQSRESRLDANHDAAWLAWVEKVRVRQLAPQKYKMQTSTGKKVQDKSAVEAHQPRGKATKPRRGPDGIELSQGNAR